uniref:Cysteine desulfuration protein SufE n=1 Tax=Candidatus Kentrum eta TaxID=2126337 RepID=A0A450VMD6_9GAMM|nr:MAG: cysteine desulfuration protein SufE [Candidatus Kentron sp. H]VFK03336.1 MAG: cysteine desulfuration protein SufE [Candidatus Kentron sp. H]VFK05968.1 MAG: cysteine desulfuration protein SufE [Candidatus Kentron sp. H]
MTLIDGLVEDFELLNDWDERFNYILELGEKLPPMPEEKKTEETLVQGCTSSSWVKGWFSDGKFDFVADSEALIGRGMLSLARNIYAGKTAREMLEIDLLDFANRTGLMAHLTPTRQKGLHALIMLLRKLATEQLALEEQA